MDIEQNLKSALAIFSFTANIAHGWLAPNNVYWSLSLEEQFHVLLPLFLLITGRRARIATLLLVIAVQFLCRATRLATSPRNTSHRFESTVLPGASWSLCPPAALGIAGLNRAFYRANPGSGRYTAAVIAGSSARAAVCLVDQHGLLAMIAAAPGGLPPMVGYLFGYQGLAGPSGRARSYGIYLIHLPAQVHPRGGYQVFPHKACYRSRKRPTKSWRALQHHHTGAAIKILSHKR